MLDGVAAGAGAAACRAPWPLTTARLRSIWRRTEPEVLVVVGHHGAPGRSVLPTLTQWISVRSKMPPPASHPAARNLICAGARRRQSRSTEHRRSWGRGHGGERRRRGRRWSALAGWSGGGVRRRGCGGESRQRGKRSVCLCGKRLIASWLLFLVVFFLIANALLFGSNVCLYGQIRAPTAGLNKIDSLFLRLQSHVPRFFLTCPTHIYDW